MLSALIAAPETHACSPSSSSSSSPAWSAARSPARCETDGGFTAGELGLGARGGADRAGHRRAGLARRRRPRRRPRARRRGPRLNSQRAARESRRSRHRPTSRDGRSASVAATLRADADEEEVAAALDERFADDRDVALGGSAVAGTQIGDSVSEDLGRAEMLAFPVLLLLSLLFFRGRATVLPLAVGITTVLGTFLALTVVNQAYALSIFALNLVIGLGLGLAIDYTLFLVTRFREELGQGRTRTRSARRCAPPAGRSSSAP